MAQRRTAEIAGGGFSGLTMALFLRRQGWRVRVHERSESIRETGAGIFLRHDPLRILESLGVIAPIYNQGVRLVGGEMRDSAGKVLQQEKYEEGNRHWIVERRVLIKAMERAAIESGVEILYGSRVTGARAAGALTTADGGEYEADLIVAADGHTSPTRESLRLTRRHKALPTLATRFVVRDRRFAPDPLRLMYWSGRRRVGIAPCGPDAVYVYLICPQRDVQGRRLPLDVTSWSASFPVLADLFEALAREEADQRPYPLVQCRRWQAGRVAIVGDAAHAQPPTLGQGLQMGLSNVCALAYTLKQSDDVPTALQTWERRYREATDRAQSASLLFDSVSARFPAPLMPLRRAVFWGFGLNRLHSMINGVELTADMLPSPRPSPANAGADGTRAP